MSRAIDNGIFHSQLQPINMSPHALATGPSSPSDGGSKTSAASLALGIKSNPFGTVADPADVQLSAYLSPLTIISQSLYAVSSKIFSYEAPGADSLLDVHLQLWAQHYARQNAFGVVPFFHKFQVRSGAANAILGYYSKNGTAGQPLSTVVPASALTYMQPTLRTSRSGGNLPLSITASAVDYDQNTGAVVSNYISALAVARALEYPVVSPVGAENGLELQHMTVLNHFIAAVSGNPSILLADGPEFARTYSRFDGLLSFAELGALYQNLLAGASTGGADVVGYALDRLNSVAGTKYAPFEYSGSSSPHVVYVVHGAHEASQIAAVVDKVGGVSKVGVITVRVPLPFNGDKFAAAVPASTKKLVVLSQSDAAKNVSTSLKADVTAALFLSGRYHSLTLDGFAYPLDFVWSPVTIAKLFAEFDPSWNPAAAFVEPDYLTAANVTANSSPEGKYLIWGHDNGPFVDVASKLALSLALDETKKVALRTKYDNSRGGGLFQAQLSSLSKAAAVSTVDSADVVLVEDASLLSSYDILATVKPGAVVLLGNKKAISSLDDVVDKLPVDFRRGLAKNHNRLAIVDFSIVEELDKISDSTKGFSADFLAQVAFWRAAFPELNSFVVNKLLQANGNSFELLAAVLDKFVATVDEQQGVKVVEVQKEWANLEDEKKEDEGKSEKEGEQKDEKKETAGEKDKDENEEAVPLPFFPTETSFGPNPRNSGENTEESFSGSSSDLAKKIVFSEAYNVQLDLRPDLPVKNFVVKVQENKRLTPSEYSRNIFHIEFDVTGTGLTYAIGEALGIHGRNTAAAVEKFLEFYNVDGDSIVQVTSKEDPSVLEVRSARQALHDNMDFLGKPPKRFYEALAEYATDDKEKAHLEKLAGPEGAEELKKRQDVDFDTFVDVLEEFSSARPPFADLAAIIPPLKRREYSIASSQKLHPNSVHLLVVVVDWVDPRGRLRYGHASKYLSDLAIGDELVVSVKPSVMKLPPLSTQPIIMSGLGTGLAPFKAFIEEKIWQKQQGMEIGAIYLFMGSRHRKEEYLYGELWEAYKDAGVLTHIGAAFSRDQPQKIYIQDKIRESIDMLTDAFVEKNGSFYLCGPTWPVPDITACLSDILVSGAKKNGTELKEVDKIIEELKEEGRYILEVY